MCYRSIAISLILLLICVPLTSGENIVVGEGSPGVTVLEQQPGRTVLKLNIPTIKLENVETEQGLMSRVSLPEDFDMSTGAALNSENNLLPTITRKIAVPFDSDPVLHISKTSYKEIHGINLAPATQEEMDSYYMENRGVSMNLQQELAVGEISGVMRDIRIYSITVAPVKYDPEHSTLGVYDEIEIEVEHAGSQLTSFGDQISEAFAPIYRSILDNPAVFDPIEVTRGAYWIIYPDGFGPQIQPYAEWKHRKGFSVEMIAKSYIGSNPSYVTIKNYITARFDTCQVKPDYIAIFGDVVMPSNLGIPTRTYSNPYGFGDIESDNYYTFILGNDYFPDIFIGRISIDYSTDLAYFLTKFFSYERTPYMSETDWYLRGTVVSGGDYYGNFVSPRITKLWCGDRMLDAGFTNVDTLFDSWTNPVYASEVSASINNGVSYVNYRGYGAPSGWTSPSYTSSNLNGLYNGPKYAVMTSIVCGTGDYNDGTDVCFGETWIRANGKGGPGFIGNSNHDAHTVWTNAIDCGIYWGLFVEDVTTLAQSQYWGKTTLWDAFPSDRYPGGQVELYFNSYNILGDPELNCWTGIPKHLMVSYDDSLQFGQNLLSVQVDDNTGSPLEYAYVCVTNDNDLFLGGFTSEDGSINFDVLPDSPGDLYVTVTSHNFIPHEGVVTCYSTDVTVGCSAHVIDDDGNGQSSGNGNGTANPSETIELGVDLYNYGQSATATGVTAVLTSESPYITVTRDTADFGNIAPGVAVGADQPYLIEISPDALPETADLVLSVTDNSGHSWSSIVQIPIETAQFEVGDVTILDNGNGIIDPGEIFEMYLSATNIGNDDIAGASAILRTADDQVTIYDSMAVFGDCAPGGSFDNSGSTFMLSADSEIYVGHIINFTVEFTGTGPEVVTASFSQTVGTVSSDDPMGPDDYGYYCFDNTDVAYADHPTYEWITIDTQNWSYVQPFDDDVIVLTLPFTVKYYGEYFDEVSICDNGHVSFGVSWWNAWHNTPIPAPQNASAMMAPLWDDLKYSSGSSQGPRIYYHHDEINGLYILGYNNAWDDDVHQYETFEIIICDRTIWPTETDDNEIVFQYYDVNIPYSVSVGICSPDRRDGIQYLFNNTYSPGAATLVDGRAIKFTTGSSYNTDVNAGDNIPQSFSLLQSYPNPFNASVTIEFSLPTAENSKLEVFNLLGQRVETLVDGRLEAGTHRVTWNAGAQASGMYFYRLTAGEFQDTKHMTLLK